MYSHVLQQPDLVHGENTIGTSGVFLCNALVQFFVALGTTLRLTIHLERVGIFSCGVLLDCNPENSSEAAKDCRFKQEPLDTFVDEP
jgi:hypothetical protein